jgi:hypothetical protein
MRQQCALGLGSRMAGSGSMMVSRAKAEREGARGQKIVKCGEREHGA